MFEYSDEYFMQHALKQAQQAFDADEVPVGALVVVNNKIKPTIRHLVFANH